MAQLQLEEFKQQMGIDAAAGPGTANANNAPSVAKESADDEKSVGSVNRSLEDELEDWEMEPGEDAKKCASEKGKDGRAVQGGGVRGCTPWKSPVTTPSPLAISREVTPLSFFYSCRTTNLGRRASRLQSQSSAPETGTDSSDV